MKRMMDGGGVMDDTVRMDGGGVMDDTKGSDGGDEWWWGGDGRIIDGDGDNGWFLKNVLDKQTTKQHSSLYSIDFEALSYFVFNF